MEETKNKESGTATPYRAALAAVGLVPSGQENVAFSGFVPQTADELQATIESLRAQIIRTAARSARRKAALRDMRHGLASWKSMALFRADKVKRLELQLEAAQARVKDLEADHKEPLGTYAALRAELEAAKTECEACDLARYAAETELEAVNKMRDEAIEKWKSVDDALVKVTADRDARVEDIEAHKAERDQIQEQARRYKKDYHAALGETQELRTEIAALYQPAEACKCQSLPHDLATGLDMVFGDGHHPLCTEAMRDPEPIASPDVLEQLAELMADEMGDPTITRTPHGMQRRMKAVAAILRAAQAYVDLPSDSIIVYRCGQTQIHGNEIAALNSRIRFRVALPETPNAQMQRCIDRKNRRIDALKACVRKWKGKAMDDPIAVFRRASDHNEWHESWVAANDPKVVADKHNALLKDIFNEKTLTIQFVLDKLKERCPACNAPKPLENIGIDWKPATKGGAA